MGGLKFYDTGPALPDRCSWFNDQDADRIMRAGKQAMAAAKERR